MIVSSILIERRGIKYLATKTRSFTIKLKYSLMFLNLLITTLILLVNLEELGKPL